MTPSDISKILTEDINKNRGLLEDISSQNIFEKQIPILDPNTRAKTLVVYAIKQALASDIPPSQKTYQSIAPEEAPTDAGDAEDGFDTEDGWGGDNVTIVRYVITIDNKPYLFATADFSQLIDKDAKFIPLRICSAALDFFLANAKEHLPPETHPGIKKIREMYVFQDYNGRPPL